MSMKGKETMSKQNEKLVVGKLGSSYGIRGWLKVFSYTDNPESIFDYSPWYIDQKGEWGGIQSRRLETPQQRLGGKTSRA